MNFYFGSWVWENVVCWFSLAQTDDSARFKTCRLGVLLLYMHCPHGVLHLFAANATFASTMHHT